MYVLTYVKPLGAFHLRGRNQTRYKIDYGSSNITTKKLWEQKGKHGFCIMEHSDADKRDINKHDSEQVNLHIASSKQRTSIGK